jgi:cytochrome o ubiquinol oxidase subunit 2
MRKFFGVGVALLYIVGLVTLVVFLSQKHSIPLLETSGEIAEKERNLILFAAGLSLVVVIPVFTLFFYIIWKFRASNHNARYTPEWDGNRTLEVVWWGVPILLIVILSIVTWNSTHDLDPFKPLASDKAAMKVQVVALQWKWLFIYPEENIATVNYVQIPKDRPIDFEITADAPMNSFWIPQLSGQIYAMSGMSTRLSLRASETGSFAGSSANISGEGFSGMKFVAESVPQDDFDQWVGLVRESGNVLDKSMYEELSAPSKNVPQMYFAASESGLYDQVLTKFLSPPSFLDNPNDEQTAPPTLD